MVAVCIRASSCAVLTIVMGGRFVSQWICRRHRRWPFPSATLQQTNAYFEPAAVHIRRNGSGLARSMGSSWSKPQRTSDLHEIESVPRPEHFVVGVLALPWGTQCGHHWVPGQIGAAPVHPFYVVKVRTNDSKDLALHRLINRIWSKLILRGPPT